ncbi:MAG: DUF3604 domain-containing protein [Bacillota bacterium]
MGAQLDAAERARWYGYATISPSGPVQAGSYGTWTITYTVGRYGVDSGGRLKVAWRLASDWGRPQSLDPKGDDYVTVEVRGDARASVSYDPKGHLRPWFHTLVVRIYDGSLKEGDQVLIILGDRRRGSKGSRAQTFCERKFEFKVLVESFETGIFVEVPGHTTLEVVSGPPARLVLQAPSEVEPGKAFEVLVRAEDRWGNPAAGFSGVVTVEGAGGLSLPCWFGPADGGVRRLSGVVLLELGVWRLRARADGGLAAESNPILCRVRQSPFRLFWGDIHGQSEETVGTGSVEDYFRFARDVAGLDFAAHAANDFQVTRPFWNRLCQQVRAFYAPGRFVTFHGYEWSGTTPAGGDHNVYFLGDDPELHRSSHWQVEDRSDVDSDRYPLSELLKTFHGRHDVMVIPHVGGRHANLDFFDPTLEPVVEVCSTHGHFEWLLQDALARGYRVGAIGGSDDHTGRPGASAATADEFAVRGGLAAVYARELTREGIWEALRARRCYATTGARIVLSLMADGHWMGEEYTTSRPPRLEVAVMGTAPVERVDLVRDGLTLANVVSAPVDAGRPVRIRVAWGGARVRGRGRQTNWDGQLRIEDGRLVGVSSFAFDCPLHGVLEWDESHARWRSMTAGDFDGLELLIEGDDATWLHFEAAPVSFDCRLGEIDRHPRRWEAGGVDQHVSIWRAASAPPKDVTAEFVDHEVPDGVHAYYARVVQVDGEMAWSSPVFVTVRKESA